MYARAATGAGEQSEMRLKLSDLNGAEFHWSLTELASDLKPLGALAIHPCGKRKCTRCSYFANALTTDTAALADQERLDYLAKKYCHAHESDVGARRAGLAFVYLVTSICRELPVGKVK